jgi:aminoglycoside 3-N-acetyltransferase
MTTERDAHDSLLDALSIESGDLLFVHASMDWLKGGVIEAVSLIEALLQRLGPGGTLSMPSYTWRGAVGRPPEKSVLDVRRSPSQVGLLSEVFRRQSATYRSEHYWVPVCGQGRLTDELLKGQSKIEHPFAPPSTFAKLLEHEAKIVGLGVSLNTSSLAHLPDYELEDELPFRVFTDTPIEGQVINHEGQLINTLTFIVKPEVMQAYKPACLFELSPKLSQSLRRVDDDSVIRFSYPLKVYCEEAVRLGREALANHVLPPWLAGQTVS